ncbi:MAG: anthranilate phosphoribosyltransferase [Spirochaetota bacterium]
MTVREALSRVIDGHDLARSEMRAVTNDIASGAVSDMLIAAFLTALRMKGETIEEITAAAEIMREKVIRIPSSAPHLVDTCGTGGDKSGTFNISTAAALLASAAGAVVAKHGNRSVSSQCGSADVLTALGIKIDITPEKMASVLASTGFSFLFAPLLHPSMKYVMPSRRELGVRTVFNVLGPLTNPAGSVHQLLGVYSDTLVKPITETLKNLGSKRAFVVHGKDGLDEITLTGASYVGEIDHGETRYYEVTPEQFGFTHVHAGELTGGSPEKNRDILMTIFEGVDSPRKDIAVLNAAFALTASGAAADIPTAITRIEESIASGAAMKKYRAIVAATNG